MLTGWTSWKFDEDFIRNQAAECGATLDLPLRKPEYLQFSEVIGNMKKDWPKILTRKDAEGKSEKEVKKLLKAMRKEWEAFEKDPWVEGKRKEGEALQKYREQCTEDLVNYCIEHRIYISPEEHQNADWGVPVFDNKYVDQFSLRSWADLMSEVWNEIMDRADLTYLDFYCNDADKVIKDYKKPSEVM